MPPFRWTPEEEAWLETQIIADDGQSGTNDKLWLDSLVTDFQIAFPFVSRVKHDGKLETETELIARWKDIPRVSHAFLTY